ncbi:MAG: hypothetical protein JRM80_11520 [Nitrososphaerota archaeon]|jgi:hypothetical protein|nr:hypothetical protein [Nitrososphaerota archaeon]MDG6975985.1 hypothetical protein [Nitrososphaerota archaeon]MDG6981506.1 hypothetical protein [Nitrososphaerota archaeon]MDG7012117.1 hypothetical protein [Nitrososphaerota archaeon]MDG7029522.1 hypothetical protein [Nitrososphaerota archaeon]
MIRRTLGRELFSWLFSSLLVVFYLQPRVSYGTAVTLAVVVLVELVGVLLGWALGGSGRRAALIRAIAVPAVLAVVLVLAFNPVRGELDQVFLALLGIQVLATVASVLVVRPGSHPAPSPQ